MQLPVLSLCDWQDANIRSGKAARRRAERQILRVDLRCLAVRNTGIIRILLRRKMRSAPIFPVHETLPGSAKIANMQFSLPTRLRCGSDDRAKLAGAADAVQFAYDVRKSVLSCMDPETVPLRHASTCSRGNVLGCRESIIAACRLHTASINNHTNPEDTYRIFHISHRDQDLALAGHFHVGGAVQKVSAIKCNTRIRRQ